MEASLRLDTLPDELILHICHFVEHFEHRNKSALRALALTNKRLSQIAIEAFYSYAIISLRSQGELQTTVDRLSNIAPHIRSLNLTGLGLYTNFVAEERPIFNSKAPSPALGWAFGYTDDNFDELEYAPLASFIPAISKLSDLAYNVVSPFPLLLLELLHKHHPRCRLQVNNLRFQGLVDSGTLTQRDWQLATSPCLHRVVLGSVHEDGWIDLTLEAVKDMVSGLAPNLKEVYIRHFFPLNADRRFEFIGSPPWKGLRNLRYEQQQTSGGSLMGFQESSPDAEVRMRRGKLEVLCIKYERDDLINWFNITDPSRLRFLDVAKVSHTTLDQLSTLGFESLKSLAISLFEDPLPSVPREQYDAAAIKFITSLTHSQLQALKIRSTINVEVCDAVLVHLGSRLRRFHIKQDMQRESEHAVIFDLKEIQRIKDSCPSLEELSIKSRHWPRPYFFQS
jgi:hypothetical protein